MVVNRWLQRYFFRPDRCIVCMCSLDELGAGNYFLKTRETKRGCIYVCKDCYTGNRTREEKRIRRQRGGFF